MLNLLNKILIGVIYDEKNSSTNSIISLTSKLNSHVILNNF